MNLEWVVDHRGVAGPVVDQGRRPTCLSCATSSAHHSVSGSARSIEFLHHTSRNEPGGAGRFETIRQVLQKHGQPPESQWPYDPALDDAAATPPADVPGPFAFADFDVTAQGQPAQLVAHLEAGRLPVIGLVTTRRFMVLRGQVLTEPSQRLGRHAVLLVGAATYTGKPAGGLEVGDTLMLVQNSWGQSWGVEGFGLIAPRAWNDMVEVAAVLQ